MKPIDLRIDVKAFADAVKGVTKKPPVVNELPGALEELRKATNEKNRRRGSSSRRRWKPTSRLDQVAQAKIGNPAQMIRDLS